MLRWRRRGSFGAGRIAAERRDRPRGFRLGDRAVARLGRPDAGAVTDGMHVRDAGALAGSEHGA